MLTDPLSIVLGFFGAVIGTLFFSSLLSQPQREPDDNTRTGAGNGTIR